MVALPYRSQVGSWDMSAEVFELRLRVLAELRAAGFVEGKDGYLALPDGDPKEVVRQVHSNQR